MKKTILILIAACMTKPAGACNAPNFAKNHREDSSETLLSSKLMRSFNLGKSAICGEIYDVQIKEEISVGLPSRVILLTSAQFEITLPWRYLTGAPSQSNFKYNKNCTPKPAPRIYAALSSLNDWRIVVYNRDENGMPLTNLKIEVYKNVYTNKES